MAKRDKKTYKNMKYRLIIIWVYFDSQYLFICLYNLFVGLFIYFHHCSSIIIITHDYSMIIAHCDIFIDNIKSKKNQ